MIEKDLYDYLKTKLTCTVLTEERGVQSGDFVILERTSGGESDHIGNATIRIRAYSTSMYGAMTLNKVVKVAMRGAVAVSSITSCKLNQDSNFTDTSAKRYCYMSIWDVFYYDEQGE